VNHSNSPAGRHEATLRLLRSERKTEHKHLGVLQEVLRIKLGKRQHTPRSGSAGGLEKDPRLKEPSENDAGQRWGRNTFSVRPKGRCSC
jgi:hypothetical protein